MLQKFIQVSPKNSRYFVYENGETYLPIGLNLAFVRNSSDLPESEVLAIYRRWMTNLSENGGNYARIWLGTPFFDVMPTQVGVYDPVGRNRIQLIIKYAEELGIKLKFTLEHFRRIHPPQHQVDTELFPGAISFNKPLYQSICSSVEEFLNSEIGREAYLGKASYLANSIGDSSAVIAIELWNEFNTISASWNSKQAWSKYMLKRIRSIFPKQMILQNLGSFSSSTSYRIYEWLSREKDNEFMQIHRYLDLGAEQDICHDAIDKLSADAIRELKALKDVPAILAEGGAVAPNHACYSELYEKDPEGTILHDVVFAPFFAGSAGCGQAWHWDHIYVEKHNLYWHFARFAKAISGIDPVAERFSTFYTETRALRIYGLRGKTVHLLWCRDKSSDWRSELLAGNPAVWLEKEKIPVEDCSTCTCYDPWEDIYSNVEIADGWLLLPTFRRSVVVRVELSSQDNHFI